MLTHLHLLQPPWTCCCYNEKEREFDVDTEEDTARREKQEEEVSKCDERFCHMASVRHVGFRFTKHPMYWFGDCNVSLWFEVFLQETGCQGLEITLI